HVASHREDVVAVLLHAAHPFVVRLVARRIGDADAVAGIGHLGRDGLTEPAHPPGDEDHALLAATHDVGLLQVVRGSVEPAHDAPAAALGAKPGNTRKAPKADPARDLPAGAYRAIRRRPGAARPARAARASGSCRRG